ncbi:MAG: phosphatidate cytidylyltransferase [Fusobacteriota bacterium]
MLGRVLVAIIFIPLLIYIMLMGNWSFLLFVEVVIGFSLYEFYRILNNKDIKVYKKTGILIALLIPLANYSEEFGIFIDKDIQYLMIIITIMFFIIRQVFFGEIKDAIERISYTVFGVLYVGLMFSHIIFIKNIPNGRYWLLALFLLIWASDSAAYFVGINFGKNKLAPKISPNKSIEGAIGGIVAPVLSMLIMNYILHFFDIGIYHTIIIGLLVGVFGELGDLAESLFKREFEVKDSGSILLGHGGMLDRFDSLLFVIPVLYYYLEIFVI